MGAFETNEVSNPCGPNTARPEGEGGTLPGQGSDSSYAILFMSAARDRALGSHGLSYGQLCISNYIRAASGFASKIFGGNVSQCSRVLRREVLSGKTGIVGFYCMQDTVMVAVHMVSMLKKAGATVIFGGPQAGALHEKEIRAYGIDFISVGEGEITTDRLLKYLLRGEGSLSSIRGIRYIDEEGVYHDNGLPEVLQNLDEIPFYNPDLSSLSPVVLDAPVVQVMTGRGCPFSCAFCHEGTTRQVRLRSVENVMAEIDYYMELSQVQAQVFFADDTFTMNPERLRRFCRELKKRHLEWGCECHVGTLARKPELIDEMVDAGLITTQIGIESGNAEVLKAYGKHVEPDQIVDIVKRFHDAGCPSVEGNLILGGALETSQSLEQSICLAEKLLEVGHLIMDLGPLYFAPFPLTPMTNHPEAYEMQLWDRPYDYIIDSMSVCVNRTKALSREEIQKGYRVFLERIDAKYREEIQKVTYTELTRFMKFWGSDSRKQSRWYAAMREVNYVWTFLMNGYRYHSLFNLDAVPLRTFSDLIYDDGALIVGGRRFTGMERTMLERANGSVTFREMARILGTSTDGMYRIYHALRENLLIYMEEF